MRLASSHAQPADWLRRSAAGACAVLVLALTIFSASPEAHAWLHVDAHAGCENHVPDPASEADDADRCAVVLFASGVALPVGPVTILPPQAAVRAVSPVTAAEVFLVSPRYLRQPERGPPADWVG